MKVNGVQKFQILFFFPVRAGLDYNWNVVGFMQYREVTSALQEVDKNLDCTSRRMVY